MTTAAVTPPQQRRSRASLDRILSAARKLLEEKTFDELTVNQVTRRARSSVGAFYSRFRDKDALLDHLDEVYAQELIEASQQNDRDLDGVTGLAPAVRTVVRMLVGFHRERRGLIRALVLQARVHPGGTFAERTRRLNRTVPDLVAKLVERAGENERPDVRGLRFGFVACLAMLREVILFPEGPAALVDDEDDDALVDRLSRVFLANADIGRGGQA